MGCELIEAPGSKKLVSVTKSRSRALSCSAIPVASGWKPMMCERRLRGIRLKRSAVLLARQYPIMAHFYVSTETRSRAAHPNSLIELHLPAPPVPSSRNTDNRRNQESDFGLG